jgi:hypothetical protein
MSSSCPTPKVCVDKKTCQSQFREKKCKCVTVKGGDKTCEPMRTVCAYEDGGVLYGCSTGCCSNQCQGQCPEDSSGAPLAIGSVSTNLDNALTRWGVAIVILLLAMVVISTVGLLA